jgi:hypothetical protein
LCQGCFVAVNGLEREKIIFKWNGEKNDETDVVALNKKFVTIEKCGILGTNLIKLWWV